MTNTMERHGGARSEVELRPGAVTVVVPSKDRHELLRRTLASILAQRGVPPEVIVVDDGSTTPVLSDDPRVRVVRHDVPRGVSSARNRGLAEVRTEWVAFCDDDDLWAPDKLRRQLRALQRVPGARWCVGGAAIVDGDLRLRSYRAPLASGWVDAEMLSFNRVPGGGSGVLASTALVREVGGFDPDLAMIADWDLYIRLALAAPLATIDAPLVVYLKHAGAMSRTSSRSSSELAAIDRRYARERAERGVDAHNIGYRLWVANGQRERGDRWSAIATYAGAMVRRPSVKVLRPLLITLVGGVAMRRAERRRLRAAETHGEAVALVGHLRSTLMPTIDEIPAHSGSIG